MKGGEERGPSLAVGPSIRSIVPFWNENEKRGKFRSFARKKYKVWHAPIDPFGGVAAMTAARRRKLECGTALCKLQSRTERHSSQSPKGSPRILQQKNRRVSPTRRETSRRFQLSNQTPQRSSQSPSAPNSLAAAAPDRRRTSRGLHEV